jgi:hypothetical protein
MLTEAQKLIMVIDQRDRAIREFNKVIRELTEARAAEFPIWDEEVKRAVKEADGKLYRINERKALYYRGFSTIKAINYQLGYEED